MVGRWCGLLDLIVLFCSVLFLFKLGIFLWARGFLQGIFKVFVIWKC